MSLKVKLKYLRIAPRKVRLVADLLRGEPIEKAQSILAFTRKKAALPFSKLLKQAMANARNNMQMDDKNLYISTILVDEGPKLKRQLPRARGRADIIHKKTSHITIILDEIDKKAKKKSLKKRGKKAEAAKVESVEVEQKDVASLEKKKDLLKIKSRQKFKALKLKKEKGSRRFFRRKAI